MHHWVSGDGRPCRYYTTMNKLPPVLPILVRTRQNLTSCHLSTALSLQT